MDKSFIRFIGFLLLVLFSYSIWATDTIKIIVKTNDNAGAIGYRVDGTDHGGLGKLYVGNGPKGKEYFFGYRKDSVFGKDIKCGSLILSKDTVANLIVQDNKCIIQLG